MKVADDFFDETHVIYEPDIDYLSPAYAPLPEFYEMSDLVVLRHPSSFDDFLKIINSKEEQTGSRNYPVVLLNENGDLVQATVSGYSLYKAKLQGQTDFTYSTYSKVNDMEEPKIIRMTR